MQNKISTFLLRILLSLCLFTMIQLPCYTAMGQGVSFPSREASNIITPSMLTAAGPNVFYVQNDARSMMLSDPSFGSKVKYKSNQTLVRFAVNHSMATMTNNAYTYKLIYKIDGSNKLTDSTYNFSATDSLTIAYTPDSLTSYQDEQLRNYPGLYNAKLTVLGLYDITTGTPVGLSLPTTVQNYTIELAMQYQPYLKTHYTPASMGLNISSSYDATKQALNVNWTPSTTPYLGKVMPASYELEWTYADDYSASLSTPLGAANVPYNFKNNATRVITDSLNYAIPVIYPRGYIIYRVRMVRVDSALYQYPIYGIWNGAAQNGTASSASSYAYYIDAAHTHTHDSLNWNYTISFAEGGKYKHVIGYFDGMLKNRQTITRFNSNPGQLLVTENIYDYEGRPAITTLPSVVNTKDFKYLTGVSTSSVTNLPYSPADFDMRLLTCPAEIVIPPFKTDALANKYYSQLNTDTADMQKYVPQAGGYPFVHTRLSPGFSDRVDKKGGAGDKLQIGMGHETINEYTNADQGDLNRLFGLNAGFKNFYTKTVTTDPNGQLSMLVKDYEGKQVATSLIGASVDTSSTAIMYNDEVPNASMVKEDVLANTTQLISGHQRIFNGNFYMDYDAGVEVKYEYTFTPYQVCTSPYLGLSVKGSYDYTVTDDCGVQQMHKFGVLGNTGVTTNPTPPPAIAIADTVLHKGKYTVDKTLSIATDDIYAAVDSFFAHKPNCAKTEDDFIKYEVESRHFPCPDTPSDPCAQLAKKMMEELFPTAKYGRYTDNGMVVGVSPSIFDVMTKGEVNAGTGYRYQSDCVKDALNAISINRFGHTYTNLASLPVDTFLFLYTYAGADQYTIARALLPLHPEYCRLLGCFVDTFETRLKSIPNAAIATKYGLFSLDSIVQKDTLLRSKLLQSPINMVHIADSLKMMMNGTVRMDTLASEVAFCLSSDSLVYGDARKIFHTQIVNLDFPSQSVRDIYFDKLRSFYFANRDKYKSIAQTGGGNSCQPCDSVRMTSYTPPPLLVPVVYNNNGTFNMGPNGLLGLFSGNLQGALAALLNSSAATMTNQDSINKYQDSATAYVHHADSMLSYVAVDSIMGRLANCVSNTYVQTRLKDSLIALIIRGDVHNGVFLPAQVRWAITSAGIPLSDLCHPYLVSYDFYDDGLGQKGSCESNTFYNGVKDFFNDPGINNALKFCGTSPTITTPSWNMTNSFASAISGMLPGTGSIGVSTVYIPVSKLYKMSCFRNGGTDSVILSLRSPVDVTTAGMTTPLFQTAGSLLFTGVSCFFEDPTAYAEGHIARFLFRATVQRTDMLGGSQYQTTNAELLGWNNGKIYMNNAGGNEIAACIPATQFKANFTGFADSMQAYGGFAADHPLFTKSLRNYMNYNLKKVFTEDQYTRFLNSCALADSMNIPMYGGYARMTFPSGPYNSFTDYRTHIAQALGLNIKALVDYTSGSTEYVLINYKTVPLGLIAPLNNDITGNNPVNNTMTGVLKYTTPGGIGRLWVPSTTNMASITAGTSLTYTGGSSVNMIRNNNTYAYTQYDMQASGLTNSQLSAAIYTVQQNLYNTGVQGYWQPVSYATVNSDYYKPEKKQLLNYTYSMQALAPSKVLDTLQDYLLEANIAAFNSSDVSYNDPSNPDRFTNLYYTGNANTYPGYDTVQRMFGWAKNTLGSNHVFINTSTNTVTASGVPGGYMNMYRCSDGLYWYRYFDGYNKLYNMYVRIPQYVYEGAHPSLNMIRIVPSNGDSATRRFTLVLLNGTTDTVYASGSTDFDISWSEELKDVLLGNEDQIHQSNPLSGELGATPNCEQQLLFDGILTGKVDYANYIDSFRRALKAAFYAHVMGQLNEKLWIEYIDKRFATTLYNYDLAGNLIQTVPPEGVHKLDSVTASYVDSFRLNNMYVASAIPQHKKVTRYEYNTVNKPVVESTPDAGDKRIYYDSKGNVILSQNAKQRAKGLFTYMLYDGQNRVTETGEVQWGNCAAFADAPLFTKVNGVWVKTQPPNACACENFTDSLWQYCLPNTFLTSADSGNIIFARNIRKKNRTQVVETIYDNATLDYYNLPAGISGQANLRSRVAANMYFENCPANPNNAPDAQPTSGYVHATHYSYDEQGNVSTIVQEIPELDAVKQRYKRVDYEYDLLSGKVDMIAYNRGFGDQFYQRYSYDADNRITKAETSRDGFIWRRDAEYSYYQHGPLARVSIGDQRVQGIDYAYTLQGWLKSINTDYNDSSVDQGGDGRNNAITPTDVFSTGINYFAGDYKPIGNTQLSNLPQQTKSLYNGNIARQTNGITPFAPLTTQYTYDQLNRIRYANNGTIQNNVITFNNWYASSYKYDMDGNIKQLVRRNGTGTVMDTMVYKYPNATGDNKLTDVMDYATFSQAGVEDIQNYTNANPNVARMLYDEIGNVIKDQTSGTDTVKWNIYGKTTDVANSTQKSNMHFLYDGSGQRIAKKQSITSDTGYVEKDTYYIRDASGNILAEYNGTSEYHNGDIRPLLAAMRQTLDPSSATSTWLNGIYNAGYMMAPEFANYVIGIGGSSTITTGSQFTEAAGYYLANDPSLAQQYLSQSQILAPLADYSRDNKNYILANCLLKEHESGYSFDDFSFFAQNLFANPDDEKAKYGIKQAAATLTMFYNTIANNFSIDPNDTDAVVQQLFDNARSDINSFTHQMFSAEYDGYADEVSDWIRAFSSDRTYFNLDDDWYVSNGLIDLSQNMLNTYSDGIARFDADRQKAKPEDVDIYAFATAWSGSIDLLNQLRPGDNLQTISYYDDPVSYTTALAARVGSLSFTDDALAQVPQFDVQLLAQKVNVDLTTVTQQVQYGTPILKYRSMSLASHHIYGSSRLGIAQYWPLQYGNSWDYRTSTYDTFRLSPRAPWYSQQYNDVITATQTTPYGNGLMASIAAQNLLGQRQYELTNHLGNVMATVSDKRFDKDYNNDGRRDAYKAEIRTAYDYYPFGMLMPGRFVQDTAQHCMLVSETKMVTTWVYTYPDWESNVSFTGKVDLSHIGSTSLTFANVSDDATISIPMSADIAGITNTLNFSVTDFRDVPFRMSLTETVDERETELSSLVIDHIGDYAVDFAPHTNNVTLKLTKVVLGNPRATLTLTTWSIKKPTTSPQTIVTQICNGGKDNYEFGFNGQMKDNEIAGIGNWNTALFGEYNTRTGVRANRDPKPQPNISPYVVFGDNPIAMSDVLLDSPIAMKPRSAYDYSTNAENSGKLQDDLSYIFQKGGNPFKRIGDIYNRDWKNPSNSETVEDVSTLKTLAEALPIVGPAKRALSTEKKFHGVGAVSGVIEVSPRAVSVGAFDSWQSGKGVEYVYDAEREIFAMGKPVTGVGSPHQRLVQAIGSKESSQIVGGTVSYKNGLLHFTENSGHFGENWTPAIRKQFSEFIKSYTNRPFTMDGFVPPHK
ncbi:polymorphic toxin type 43 domain-containing protein [Chitinophagaceae bacterium MMS25-I14]